MSKTGNTNKINTPRQKADNLTQDKSLNLNMVRSSIFLTAFGLITNLPVVRSYASGVPRIIQGGMGVRISSWKLAREVSKQGQLGVISGTAMETIMIRSLQEGDSQGAFRRALSSFPDQGMVHRVLEKFYIPEGKGAETPYRNLPMWTIEPKQSLLEATVLANYCEVWLAKHNDDDSEVKDSLVGINLLTKVQLPTVPSLYGAMIAGVDYVLMGAGIPMSIPSILDNLVEGKDCELPIEADGIARDKPNLSVTFSPKLFWTDAGKPELAEMVLKRPNFVPIVSSVVLAQSMLKRAGGKGPTGGINGFVVELPAAGGHNAPPRGFKYDSERKTHAQDLNERGEPIYGPKDDVDLEKFQKASSGLPFWLAGAYAHPDKLCDVVDVGASGVQVGTLFALSDESGMDDEAKQRILGHIASNDMDVFTDPAASPTGFPFKVLQLDGTLSDEKRYLARPRVCNLGYLRTPFLRPDGKIGYRCASEPVDAWVKKGGDIEATKGRKCLCNSLCANAGFPQVRNIDQKQYKEEILITIGDDVNSCKRFLKKDEKGRWSYSAKDVIDNLLSEWEERKMNAIKSVEDDALKPTL